MWENFLGDNVFICFVWIKKDFVFYCLCVGLNFDQKYILFKILNELYWFLKFSWKGVLIYLN